MSNAELFINEQDYSDLHGADAVEHLRQVLRFETTSYVDTSKIRYGEFDRLHAFLRETYPAIMEAGVYEEIGHSVLITIPGTDPELEPGLFMAHQDVVPVVPGTLEKWLHEPFSGDLADGYIWGRGAMDIKQMLIAILEAGEYLLENGQTFRRTTYFAFGEDEETRSTGARAISNLLKARGVKLAFVLDEGAGDVMDAADYGAPGELICPIGICEKGYVDIRIRASARGGHSSNPFHGTSLGNLSRAITEICDNLPEAHLSYAVLRTFDILRPMITQEPLRSWTTDPAAHQEDLLSWCLSHASLYHQVRTSAAPTMIDGGSAAANVMPGNMEAVINFRLTPPDTPESLMERCRSAVSVPVELEFAQQVGPSIPSDIDAFGYRCLHDTLEHYFDRLHFIPMQNRGATDARQYEQICRCVLRFGPFLEEEDISAEGIHGTNERISVRAFLQGIRVLIRMMETACIGMDGAVLE